MTTEQRNDEIRRLWNAKYFDACACGYSDQQATKIANDATASRRAEVSRIERISAPRTPRHTNLAGRRQYLERVAQYGH